MVSNTSARSINDEESGSAEPDDTDIELDINVDVDGKPGKSVQIPLPVPNARGNLTKCRNYYNMEYFSVVTNIRILSDLTNYDASK